MFEEDPLRNTCLVPRNLVMTQMACFYCGMEDSGQATVVHLFGIKHCNTHKEWAHRDCRSYMHREKLVVLNDIPLFPAVNAFFSVLYALPNGFPVKRSSGIIQPNWNIHINTTFDKRHISFTNGQWLFPSIYCDNGIKIIKGIAIDSFLEANILSHLETHIPNNFSEIVKKCIDALNLGVYIKDQEAFMEFSNQDTASSNIIR